MTKPCALFLMGPTASGKTALALELAKHLPVEIISVDSALIYRGMDIGSAKPTAAECAQVPHYLLDICDPAESYSAADFYHDARRLMSEISSRGKIPLLVGGTMLYFKALLEGLSPLPSADPAIRAEIDLEAKELGWAVMHQKLALIDPVSAERIHPNDPQRLMRAIEVFRITGKSLTELTQIQGEPLPWQVIQCAIAPAERSELHRRIALRFEIMINQGFQTEVERLRARGDLHLELPSMRCVGYRQMWEHLDGDYDANELRERAVAATRQLAKRQLTWLRNWNYPITWLDSDAAIEANVAQLIQLWQAASAK